MIVGGTVRAPGDKSITHRALLFAAMARGASHIGGALASLDTRGTARVLRQLGAEITALRAGQVVGVAGRGRLRASEAVLHCGNSGTTARLLLGLLAAHRFRTGLTGDRSLRRRPMGRVTEPLGRMGARFHGPADVLPLQITGGRLHAIRHELPVSSAQLKSALLLAGAAAGVDVSVREPAGRSRDHTERLLRAFGFEIGGRDGWIDMRATGRIVPFDLQVPGDLSSAVFLIGAGVLAAGGSLRIASVGMNPTRTGALKVLARMGGAVGIQPAGSELEEPVADLFVRPSPLRGTEVTAGEIPGLIDEVPMLAALASQASGSSVFRDVGELRVKESNRLELIAVNLRALGAAAEVQGDDLWVAGGSPPPRGRVRTDGDHRLAMAFAVLGTLQGARVSIDDMACAAVSFPGFSRTLRSLAVRGSR